MKTSREQMKEASETCTYMDIIRPLDRLRNSDGGIDSDKLRDLIQELNKASPLYKSILKCIAYNLED